MPVLILLTLPDGIAAKRKWVRRKMLGFDNFSARVELLRPLDAPNLERVGKMLSDLVAVTNTLVRIETKIKLNYSRTLATSTMSRFSNSKCFSSSKQRKRTSELVRIKVVCVLISALSAIIEAVKLTEETVVE